jgi:hypothetical protein
VSCAFAHMSRLCLGRYLQNNTLNGSVPSWICDLYSYNLSNNQFACPLPSCCSSSGNDLCEPCFNVTSPPPPSSSVDCCLYTNATTRDPAGVQCAGTNGCIALAGVDVTAFRQVDDCGTCFKHTEAPGQQVDCCVYTNRTSHRASGVECAPRDKCIQSVDLALVKAVFDCEECFELAQY